MSGVTLRYPRNLELKEVSTSPSVMIGKMQPKLGQFGSESVKSPRLNFSTAKVLLLVKSNAVRSTWVCLPPLWDSMKRLTSSLKVGDNSGKSALPCVEMLDARQSPVPCCPGDGATGNPVT